MAAVGMEVRVTVPARLNGSGANSVEGVPVVYKDSAYRLMTPQVREVLDGLIPFVERHAQTEHIPLRGIEVRGIPASDESWEQLILAMRVALPLDEAYTYWGELSGAVEAWTRTLPVAQADVLLDLIGLEVWEDQGDAPI